MYVLALLELEGVVNLCVCSLGIAVKVSKFQVLRSSFLPLLLLVLGLPVR